MIDRVRCVVCRDFIAEPCITDECPANHGEAHVAGIERLPALPYTALDAAMLAAQNEVLTMAVDIEAEHAAHHDDWDALTIENSWHGCNSALDDARTTMGKPEQHRYLVRLAAWALVVLRAEARAGKGGGHG